MDYKIGDYEKRMLNRIEKQSIEILESQARIDIELIQRRSRVSRITFWNWLTSKEVRKELKYYNENLISGKSSPYYNVVI